MRHPNIILFALLLSFLLLSGCSSSSEETASEEPVSAPSTTTDTATPPAPPVAATPPASVPCPLTSALVKQYCTVSANAELEPSSSYCSISVKPIKVGQVTFGVPLITFSTAPWAGLKEGYASRYSVWDESGIGEESFLTSLPGMGQVGRDMLDTRGYYLFVKKDDLAYQFVGQPKNPDGSCAVAQMKALAQAVLGQ